MKRRWASTVYHASTPVPTMAIEAGSGRASASVATAAPAAVRTAVM